MHSHLNRKHTTKLTAKYETYPEICDGTSIHYHEGPLQSTLAQEAARNNPVEAL